MTDINYNLIGEAIAYYREQGYIYREVPWHVSKSTLMLTSPKDRRIFQTIDGCLVASGEQSFLEESHLLTLDTKYVCATPCFRDEPGIDFLHQRAFFKVELIHVRPDRESEHEALLDMLGCARSFFERHLRTKIVRVGKQLGMAYDIESAADKIELGSYGIRHHRRFRWIYGTGVAEPRFSCAKTLAEFKSR